MTDCTLEEVCVQKFDNMSSKIDNVVKNLNDKLSVANHRISDLENETKEIININNVLIELQLLSKLQREDSIKRDKTIEEMNKNQIEITNTLKTLTNSLKNTDLNVDKLAEQVDKNNIELNKKFDDISKDNTINILSIIKNLIILGIGSGATIIFTSLLK